MTQQINLLPQRQKRSVGAEIWAGVAVLALLVAVFGYRQWLVIQNSEAEDALATAELQVAKTRAAMNTLQKQRVAQNDGTAIAAEISVLRSRTDAASQLLNEVQSGSLGSPQGYARQFAAVGSLAQDGLWLTAVSVDKGGAGINLTGRALRTEAVMQYARRANEAFAPFGVRFSALEFSPEGNAARPASAAANPNPIAFKLSSKP
jgi:hypothetical protein